MLQVHVDTIRAGVARVLVHHAATTAREHELQAEYRRPPEPIQPAGAAGVARNPQGSPEPVTRP